MRRKRPKRVETKLVKLSTAAAHDVKVSFLAASVAGAATGQDVVPLLAYADWLEEMGHVATARSWRREVTRWEYFDRKGAWASEGSGTHVQRFVRGRLDRMAYGPIRACTAFKSLEYSGPHNPDGSFYRADNSLEYAARVNGYVPTLRRGSARQSYLGRLVEAFGLKVSWIE